MLNSNTLNYLTGCKEMISNLFTNTVTHKLFAYKLHTHTHTHTHTHIYMVKTRFGR